VFSSPGLGTLPIEHPYQSSAYVLNETKAEKMEKEKGKSRDIWGIPKQNSAERIKDKDRGRERKEKEKEKEKERDEEKEKEKEGKSKRSFSVRDGATKVKERLTRTFDDALDFVDGR